MPKEKGERGEANECYTRKRKVIPPLFCFRGSYFPPFSHGRSKLNSGTNESLRFCECTRSCWQKMPMNTFPDRGPTLPRAISSSTHISSRIHIRVETESLCKFRAKHAAFPTRLGDGKVPSRFVQSPVGTITEFRN